MNRKSLPFAHLVAFLASLGFVPSGVGAQMVDVGNLLKGSLGVHDPSTVVKSNGTYFVYGTYGYLTSKDRITWASNGKSPTSTTQSWWAAHGGQIWAPDVTYLNGAYYCYYSVSGGATFSASAVGLTTNTTLDPSASGYKWVDQGMALSGPQGAAGGWGTVNVIDPSTIVDDNGRWYLAYGSFQTGVRLVELNTKTGMPKDNPPVPIEITNHAGEGSAVAHWGKYYYYAISQGKCCANMKSTYAINYARATAVGGPYTTKSGGTFLSSTVEKLLRGTNDSTNKTSGVVVAVGVGGFFWDHIGGTMDTLFLDYMAYTAPSGGALLSIKPVYADASGWLTMDPAKGTVMTRTPQATSIEGAPVKGPGSMRLAGDKLHLGLPGWTRASLEVFDLSGRKVGGSPLSVRDGGSELDLRTLAGGGVREVRVTGDGERFTQQMVLP